jgi:PIN domain nuclease of toxin-antitoxin system
MEAMGKDLAASIPLRIRGHMATSHSPPASGQLSRKLMASKDTKPYMAIMTIWPLGIASRLGNLDVEQRSWFRSEVARLGRLVGYGNIESAEAWPEL